MADLPLQIVWTTHLNNLSARTVPAQRNGKTPLKICFPADADIVTLNQRWLESSTILNTTTLLPMLKFEQFRI